jgi:signal peptidase I
MLETSSQPATDPTPSLAPPLPVLTHGGLDDVDPWAPPAGRSLGQTLWPWGLAQISETLEVIALAIIMFVAVRSVAQNFVVDGASMLPSFHNGELLIVNRLAYRTFDVSWIPGVDKSNWEPFGQPEIGDVIVFKFPLDQSRDFIKRVIGLPGQTVAIHDDKVFVDGRALTEPYILDAPNYTYGPTVVPSGDLFVLGDNRDNSYDSHSWGMLDQHLIIGRADVRYWPFSQIGLISHARPLGSGPSGPAPASTSAQPQALRPRAAAAIGAAASP